MKSRWFVLAALLPSGDGCGARRSRPTPPASGNFTPIIKKETALVLVDTVVTDKQGNYIRDLTPERFSGLRGQQRTDGQELLFGEQCLRSFGQSSSRYLVLFFDNSTMNAGDQAQARAAALKFLDANTGANRYIAIVNFDGTLQVAQNFTTDAERLKAGGAHLKFSAASIAPSRRMQRHQCLLTTPPLPGVPQLGNMRSRTSARARCCWRCAIMAKGLANVPGRKSLVLLSSGFPMNPSDPNYWVLYSELTAAIDSCNKANVAIYPSTSAVWVRLVRRLPSKYFPPRDRRGWFRRRSISTMKTRRMLVRDGDQDATAHLVNVQKGGGGGHSGGGSGSGARGVNTGGNSNATSQPYHPCAQCSLHQLQGSCSDGREWRPQSGSSLRAGAGNRRLRHRQHQRSGWRFAEDRRRNRASIICSPTLHRPQKKAVAIR